MAREEFKITKLIKPILKTNPEDGSQKMVDDDKYALDKDIEKWEKEGYKIDSVEIVFRNLTQKQKERYLEGKYIKKTRKEKTPAERAQEELFRNILGSSVEELAEICEQYELDIVLGKYPKLAEKQAAVINAIEAQEAEAKASVEMEVSTEEPKEDEGSDEKEDEEEALIQRVKGCTIKALGELVEELELDIDLDDYSRKAEMQDAVIAVIKNKE